MLKNEVEGTGGSVRDFDEGVLEEKFEFGSHVQGFKLPRNTIMSLKAIRLNGWV